MATAIGKLRTKLFLIQFTSQEPDGYGGLTKGSKATKRTFFADVQEASGSRKLEIGRQTLGKTFTIIARYNSQALIAVGDYLIYNGKTLVIQGTINTDNNRFIQIDAEEVDTETVLTNRFMTISYTATGGETSFTSLSLINVDVIGAFKEGAFFDADATAPSRLKVKHTLSTGQITWPDALSAGEKITVLYQDL
jgi:SPP1 family predicted phage head-tail adaptor